MLEKVDPYPRPLLDALYDMLDADRLASYMEKGIVEVAPLAFMRGRTLNDPFIILDEAQNTSPEQMQMFLTRLVCLKVVVTGDVTQVDSEQASGLDPGAGHPRPDRRRRLRPVRPRRRGSPQARAANRRGLPHACGGDRHAASEVIPSVITVEIVNRSGAEVDEDSRKPRPASAGGRGDRGRRPRPRLRRAGRDARLKRDHLGEDEVTDVLAFPIDGANACRRGFPPARRCGSLPAGRGSGLAGAARARAVAPPRL